MGFRIRRPTARRQRPALLWVLLSGIVVPWVLATGTLGYLAWRAQQQTVENLVSQLQERVGDRIIERITHLTSAPVDATVLIQRALDRGSLSPTNFAQWEPYLIDQGITFDALSALYFGNHSGDFALLEQAHEQPGTRDTADRRGK